MAPLEEPASGSKQGPVRPWAAESARTAPRGDGSRKNWTSAGMALVALAIAMFACVFLLTPLSGLETRNPSSIHPIGIFSLVLVFLTAALDAVAIVLLSRRPHVSALLAGLGIFLVLPGFYLDQTGQFAPSPPPTAIRDLEFLMVSLQAALFVIAVWLRRQLWCAECEDTAGTESPPVSGSA
jgi:hypothetical protein